MHAHCIKFKTEKRLTMIRIFLSPILRPYSNDFIEKVEDVVKEGQEIKVKIIGIDDQKRVKLSRKATLKDEELVKTD